MFDILEADIVIIQETKIQRKDLRDDMVLVPGWDVYFSLPRHKKGYSGVAVYTRNATCAPIRAEEGVLGVLSPPKSSTSFRDLPKDQQIGGYPRPDQLSGVVDEATLDSEGRCVILEFPAFVLLGVYSPANRDESRDDFRLGFLEALDVRIRNLVAEGKEVILTGDLNIVGSELDSSNVAESLKKNDMTVEEWQNLPSRRLFNQLVFGATVSGNRDERREQPVLWDLCRCFHPTRQGMNTCWDTKKNTRPANYGSRIDYVLCSDGLKSWFVEANIQEGLMGSDHCPVYAVVADTVARTSRNIPLLDIVNPPGMFENGQRQREWGQKDLLPLSAKLIPEFDRRQSIRDMFTKKASNGLNNSTQTPTTQATTAPHTSPEDSVDSDFSRVSSNELAVESSIAKKNGPSGHAISAAINRSPIQTTAQKRSADSPGTADATTKSKRSKLITDNAAKNKVAPGQRTLQGFFKPKPTSTKKEEDAASVTNSTVPTSPAQAALASTADTTNRSPAKTAEDAPPPRSELATPVEWHEKVFDPIESKESWSKLLGKRVVPRCEHDEPCISLLTKKSGVNCGRSFYICPRPLGPSGEKEKGSEWRCGTFIWSSDWNGSSS
ncbi:DNA-like protein [Emericellopsis cladophorae]|uniref:DNA-(apurinic or apyrimidinic site) endonuclease 2 n=1 Tax=Emericellopsis cladophorae TaxID=2686198 RepID=A0A9Q0BDI7_9HYPO|nr:DNA-like protein [Emericellopsis cladophorae]KAI6780590.1 DNA-like protein [Emericellopsis cladophorae]